MTMDRRTFLRFAVGGTLGASALVVGAGLVQNTWQPPSTPLLDWDRSAPLFPGLPLRVGLLATASGTCQITVVTRRDTATHLAPMLTLDPGDSEILHLPFPHDRLIPGHYEVELVALTTDGQWQDRQTIGQVVVSGLRFGV